MTDEKTDLEQLMQSAGWLRFLEYARQHWAEQLPARMVAAANLGGDKASLEVLKLSYAASEINALLSYPKERLTRLQQPETKTVFSRGGYGPQS